MTWGPVMELMSREMAEQPVVLGRLVDRFPQLVEAVAGLLPRPPGSVVLLARGSSDNAALLGRYAVELVTGRPVALAAPSLVTRYGVRSDYRGVLVVAVSQSGQTPEITQTASALRRAGAVTVAVTNDVTSPLATAVDLALDLGAGEERAVPATKTVTAQMLVLLAVAGALGPLSLGTTELTRLPVAVARALDTPAPVQALADRWAGRDALLVVARGLLLSAAHETALKIRECAGVAAVGMASSDLLHGPVAALRPGSPVLVLAGDPATDADLDDLERQLAGRDIDLARLDGSAEVSPLLAPLVATVRGQQLGRALARARGLDPDRPAGLAKVTRTH